MGMRASAAIFFGYDLGEDSPDVDIDLLVDQTTKTEHDAVDWDSAPKRPNWRPDYYTSPEYTEYQEKFAAWQEATKADCQAWLAAKERVKKEIGVGIGWYGALGDYSQFYIYALGSEVEGDWGEPTEVPMAALEALPIDFAWTDKLHSFMNEHEIEIPEGDPKWLLVVSYG